MYPLSIIIIIPSSLPVRTLPTPLLFLYLLLLFLPDVPSLVSFSSLLPLLLLSPSAPNVPPWSCAYCSLLLLLSLPDPNPTPLSPCCSYCRPLPYPTLPSCGPYFLPQQRRGQQERRNITVRGCRPVMTVITAQVERWLTRPNYCCSAWDGEGSFSP